MSRGRDLTKKTAIIAVGRISTQFVSFLLLPLYTALLSTAEYGTVDLVITIAQLLIPVASLMIDQGAFRYLLNCETDEDRKTVITSAFFLSGLTAIGCLVIYLIASVFVNNPLKIWVLLILVAISFSNLFLQMARGLKHTSDYALGSFISSSVTIILNVICIAFIHMGATGMLTATFFGNLACAAFLFTKLKVYNYISAKSFSLEILKKELHYSIPLVPNQLSLWVMNSSDRFIVSIILGTAANGLLAVSHKFPTLYMAIFNIFQLAWHEMGAIHYFDEDRDEFFTDMIKKVVTVFSTLCMCIIVALPLVFDWFINVDYHNAYYNIPIYLVASLFNVVVGLLGVVYVATKKTSEIAKTTMLAAAINIVVNISLINYIGLFAASVSTFIGYGVVMVYRIIDTKKYLTIKYDKKQFASISAALIVCSIIYYIDNKVVSLLFLPLFLIAAYLFNKEIVDEAMKIVLLRISKKTLIICGLIIISCVLGVAGVAIHYELANEPKFIESEYKGDIKVAEEKGIIEFSTFDEEDFTCTGMAYDTKDCVYWVGDYGSISNDGDTEPRVIQINKQFTKVIGEIRLNSILNSSDNLQGVAYDGNNNSIWLAVGNRIIEISKEGELQNTISMNRYAVNKANGVSYDESDDTLWVLCASKYLLHLNKDGSVIKEYPFNYENQDHLCIVKNYIYITVGADYHGNDNFVCKVNKDDCNISKLYRMDKSYSIEGICNTDGNFYVSNDGYYHHDERGHSYITVYDEKTLSDE